MNRQDHLKELRTDFMQGHGKASEKDNLTRQRPGRRRVVDKVELTDLYATNAIVQNIVDIPAEDMTRSWFSLKMEDESLKNDIMAKLNDLKAKDALKKMRSYERLYGDGFVSLGVNQSTTFDLSKPIEFNKLKKLEYLNAFSGNKVSDFVINEDMFDINYGQVAKFRINRLSRTGQHIIGASIQDSIDRTRVLHDQTRRLEDEYKGQSLIEPLYDILTVLDTSLWSVGQMLYDYVFKIYKADGISDLSKADKAELGMLMDYGFKTEALAIIGSNEELKKEATNTTGIKDLLDYVWDYLSGAVRMPKSVIKGQESGTITGAQYDVMNYYARIASMQENELRPHIDQLIRILLWCSDECGPSVDPDTIDWDIQFNPLWQVDSKTDAEIRKLIAESDQIYIANGVITSDEVREVRFGQFGLTNALKFHGDSADIEKMAKEIYSAWREKNNG